MSVATLDREDYFPGRSWLVRLFRYLSRVYSCGESKLLSSGKESKRVEEGHRAEAPGICEVALLADWNVERICLPR